MRPPRTPYPLRAGTFVYPAAPCSAGRTFSILVFAAISKYDWRPRQSLPSHSHRRRRVTAASAALTTATLRPICRRRGRSPRRRRRMPPPPSLPPSPPPARCRPAFRRLPHSPLLSGSSEPPPHPLASSASLPCLRRRWPAPTTLPRLPPPPPPLPQAVPSRSLQS